MAKKRGKVTIDREMCKGCYLCINSCPFDVLEADTQPNATGTYPVIATHMDKCTACGNCYQVCPDVCIEVYELEGVEV